MALMAKTHRTRRAPKVRADDPEPSIADLLDDPVLQILMSRDGVERDALLDLIDAARLKIGVAGAFEATLFAECRS
jgi:hypothetical protein